MRIGLVAAVSVLLVAGLAGCAPSTGNGVATVNRPTSKTTTGSSSAKALTPKQLAAAGIKFATCMRAHGIQMNDPKTSGGGMQISINGQYSKDKVSAAQKACSAYLPAPSGAGGPSGQGAADALKYSSCMRAHGVTNFPDPSADGALRIDGSKIDMNSPTFKAADKVCHPNGGATRHQISGSGGGNK